MFLHLSVILFTGERGSLSREGLCPGGSHSGGHCPGGLCPGGFLSMGVSVQEGLCPGSPCQGESLSRGSLSRGVSVQGRESLSGRPPSPTVVRLRAGGKHPTGCILVLILSLSSS